MWLVKCDLPDGSVGKLVTGSWFKAALQFGRWRLKGRHTTLTKYVGEAGHR